MRLILFYTNRNMEIPNMGSIYARPLPYGERDSNMENMGIIDALPSRMPNPLSRDRNMALPRLEKVTVSDDEIMRVFKSDGSYVNLDIGDYFTFGKDAAGKIEVGRVSAFSGDGEPASFSYSTGLSAFDNPNLTAEQLNQLVNHGKKWSQVPQNSQGGGRRKAYHRRRTARRKQRRGRKQSRRRA